MKRAVLTGLGNPILPPLTALLKAADWEVEIWATEGDGPAPLQALSLPQPRAVDFGQPIALERRLAGVDALFHLRRMKS